MALFHEGMATFAILQDENRQRILLMLCDHPELTVTEITDRLHLSRPAVSHHLKLMKDAGLVGVRQEGKERFYHNELEQTISLLKALTTSLERDNNRHPRPDR